VVEAEGCGQFIDRKEPDIFCIIPGGRLAYGISAENY
jgi:hypothetical protein